MSRIPRPSFRRGLEYEVESVSKDQQYFLGRKKGVLGVSIFLLIYFQGDFCLNLKSKVRKEYKIL